MSKKDTAVKADEQPASRPPKKWEMQLRVQFTDPEINAIAKKLAEANADLIRAEEDKKAVTSQLKAKCEGIAARVGELSGKINSGFEYRNVPVVTTYDNPKVGMKTTVRMDTGEVVECEPMTLAEMQRELALTGPAFRAEATKKTSDTIRRTVTGDGVVVTEEDGDPFTEEDDHKL
jgi:hypothetical protein